MQTASASRIIKKEERNISFDLRARSRRTTHIIDCCRSEVNQVDNDLDKDAQCDKWKISYHKAM